MTRCSELAVQFSASDLVWTWPWRPQSESLGRLLDQGSSGPQWVGQGGFQEAECHSQLASLSAPGGCHLEVVPIARLLVVLIGSSGSHIPPARCLCLAVTKNSECLPVSGSPAGYPSEFSEICPRSQCSGGMVREVEGLTAEKDRVPCELMKALEFHGSRDGRTLGMY